MNDLDVIVALRPEVALPSADDLRESRRQLVDAIGAVTEAPLPHQVDVRSRAEAAVPVARRRLAPVTLLVVAGAVAVVTAGLVLVLTGPSTPGRHHPSTVGPARLTAVQFLDRAASAVREDSGTAPQPDQFVYSETENPDGTLDETWLSVDGSRPGLTSGASGGGGNQIPACTVAQAETTGCYPEAGYFPDIPAGAGALLRYLNRIQIVDTTGQDDSLPGWTDNDVAKAIFYLMQTTYLLPAQQAALYNLMAQTPGFHVVPDVDDAIGRTGVGIEWTFDGDSGAVIFDPVTYAYLGVRTWPGPADVQAAYDGDALVKVAIVDSAGQLPA